MEFMKVVLCTILIIGIVIAAVYGVIEIVDLVIDLGRGTVQTTEQIVNPQDGQPNIAAQVQPEKISIWEEHCRGLVLSASALAVMFIGWTQILEYWKN